MPIPNVPYKPREQKFKKAPATITQLQDRVRVVFDDMAQKPFDVTLDKVTGPIVDGPAFVTLSLTSGELLGARPLNGPCATKFKEIAAPEDQAPAPRRYEGTYRDEFGQSLPYSYEAFTALLEITRGEWAGAIIPVFLRYKFVDSGDGETAGIAGRGIHTERLYAFLEYAGLDANTTTIPLSENVLPWLEKTLQQLGKEFQTVLVDGYAEAFAPMPDSSWFTPQADAVAPPIPMNISDNQETEQSEEVLQSDIQLPETQEPNDENSEDTDSTNDFLGLWM